jgi:hypothetical protein
MAPKKSARKKAAKQPKKLAGSKFAKKPAKKRPKAGAGGKDLRRAYEHLHRVSVLHDRLETDAKRQVDALTRTAQSAMADKDAASAADLLRAAEHTAFASLAPLVADKLAADKSVSDTLMSAARAQYELLVDRASYRWEDHDETAEAELAAIFHHLLGAAEEAYACGALHRALEFARGAEALAHTRPGRQRKVPAG